MIISRVWSWRRTLVQASIGATLLLCPPSRADELKHLPSTLRGFRLSGESASTEWPVFLTSGEAKSALRFQLGYLAAVSVMPEASKLTVFVNDEPVGSTLIRGGGLQTSIFTIPRDLARPGVNSIRISAQERHRVDCSVRATYELWTQIDPETTGLLLAGAGSSVRDLQDLPALSPDGEGALPIRLTMPSPSSAHGVERAILAVEELALTGRFEQPLVDVGKPAAGPYGLNLAIGARNRLAALGVAMPGPGSGPQVAVIPAPSGGRPTIVVTGDDESDLDAAVAQLRVRSPIEGSPAGLRALRDVPGLRVRGRVSVALSSLGTPSEAFAGRLFRTGFDVSMPADFYPADYGKASIDLDGGYAAGLAPGAEVLIKVNDRDAASLRLADRSGDLLRSEPIPIELGDLRPGINRIDIEAHVPTAADRGCDPLAASSGSERFLFLNSTRIDIPPIARIARAPDLAVTATGGFLTNGTRKPTLWLPIPNQGSVAAAADIAAQFARASGAAIPFELTVARPSPKDDAVLAIAPAGALPSDLLADAGLDGDRLAEWGRSRREPTPRGPGDRLKALEADSPAACHERAWPIPLDPRESASTSASDDFATLDSKGWAEKWRERLRRNEDWTTGVVRAAERAGQAIDWAVQQILSSNGRGGGSGGAKRARASLIVGQAVARSRGFSLWTFVTAPDSADLARAAGCLVDPRVWRRLSGEATFLDASSGRAVSVASARLRLVQTRPLSIENVRLISAGWMSLNPDAFVLCALASALALAATTAWFVGDVGRRSK